MRESDLDAVMQIEQLSFRLPWSRQVFLEELSRPWAFLDVVRAGGGSRRVLAFCNYWRVADEVHILKVATHPDARRFGFGSRLLAHIVDFARPASLPAGHPGGAPLERGRPAPVPSLRLQGGRACAPTTTPTTTRTPSSCCSRCRRRPGCACRTVVVGRTGSAGDRPARPPTRWRSTISSASAAADARVPDRVGVDDQVGALEAGAQAAAAGDGHPAPQLGAGADRALQGRDTASAPRRAAPHEGLPAHADHAAGRSGRRRRGGLDEA